MPNVTISDLPPITLPFTASEVFLEAEAMEGGVAVSRKVAVSDISGGGGGGIVVTIVAGENIAVDSTDPANPIVSATGGGVAGFGRWRYRTAVTADPTAGRLQFDNIDIASATNIYINVLNDDGTDASFFLALLAPGNLLYIQITNDASQYVLMEVGTSSLAADVYTFPITNITGAGTPPSNNTRVSVIGATIGAGGGGGSLPSGNQFDLPYISTAPNTYSATSALQITPATPELRLQGAAPIENIARYSADALSAAIALQKSRNAAVGGQTALSANDLIGTVSFQGSDGAAFQPAASIEAAVDFVGASAGSMPGRLTFYTSLDGGVTLRERMRINNLGQVIITPSGGTAIPTNPQQVGSLDPRLAMMGTFAVIESLDQFGNDANGPIIASRKSRGAGLSNFNVVQSGDSLGRVTFYGTDGSVFQPSVQLLAAVDGTPGASDMPGRLVISTSRDGSATLFERARFTNYGSLHLTGDDETYTSLSTAMLVLAGTTNAVANVAAELYRFRNDSNGAPLISLAKSRGATVGAQTIVVDGDTLGDITFRGSDGVTFRNAARISSFVDGTPGSADMPGRLVFSTTLDGASTTTERMRIRSTGAVVITVGGATYVDPSAVGLGAPNFTVQSLGASTPISTLELYSNDTTAPIFGFRKSRGTVLGTLTALSSGDALGQVSFQGVDTSPTYRQAARINALVDAAPTGTVVPGAITISTSISGGSGSPQERLRVSSSGVVTISAALVTFVAPLQIAGSINPTLALQSAQGALTLDTYSSTAATANIISLRRSRSGSLNTQTIVASGDTLGDIRFEGSNGTTYSEAARIAAEVDGTPGASNDMPGRLMFYTTPDGSGTATERGRITQDGRWVWGAGGTGPVQFFGTGSPEGVVTAPVGSVFQRSDGGIATSLYLKEVGSGNTGWSAMNDSSQSYVSDVRTTNLTMADATLATCLTVTLEASTRYTIEAFLAVTVNTADDFQFDFVEPTSATINGIGIMRATANPPDSFTFTQASTSQYQTSGGVDGLVLSGYILTSSAGTLTLRAAKQADTGADGTVYQGSWMTCKKL